MGKVVLAGLDLGALQPTHAPISPLGKKKRPRVTLFQPSSWKNRRWLGDKYFLSMAAKQNRVKWKDCPKP